MTDTEKQIDEKKGDDVLRRLLKTPPDHRQAKSPRKEKTQKDGEKIKLRK